MRELKEIIKYSFSDDFIKIFNKKINPFTFLWWLLRIGAVVASCGAIYCLITIVLILVR